MKTVKFYAYLEDNVGDDLMVEVLLNRYPNYRFYYENLHYPEYSEKSNKFASFHNFCNVDILEKKYAKINKFFNLITFHKCENIVYQLVHKHLDKSCIAHISIAGSIYRENPNDPWQARKQYDEKMLKTGPVFIIGANFGPYYDPAFYDYFKNYFGSCASVCFRDQYSYNLFSGLQNVFYAPDVVLNYKPNILSNVNKDKVLISVISFEKRPELQKYETAYYNSIVEFCIKAISDGMRPVLASFCEPEKDNIAVDRIYDMLPADTQSFTEKYYYKKTSELKNILSAAKFVVATRFHSIILSLLYNVPFFCVAYDQKCVNLLSDLKYPFYCTPGECSKISPKEMYDNILSPETIIPNLKDYIKKAEGQFTSLDYFLNNQID